MAFLSTSTPIRHPEKSTIAHSGEASKRVILRLRVDDFEGEGRDWEQHVDAIDT